MSVFNVLLLVHIVAGTAALTAATVAVTSKTLDVAHRWHVYAGKAFFWAMVVIFLTAIPMALIKGNTPLFFIAIFSFYFALAGWRFAKNRRGTPQPIDWIAAGLMAVASVIMIGFGIFIIVNGNLNGIILLAFGILGAVTTRSDLQTLRAGGVKGKERVANHLSRMLGGTIATLTAFVVTNVRLEPLILVWLGPTIILTPVIIWWERRLTAGVRPRGMPSTASRAGDR